MQILQGYVPGESFAKKVLRSTTAVNQTHMDRSIHAIFIVRVLIQVVVNSRTDKSQN